MGLHAFDLGNLFQTGITSVGSCVRQYYSVQGAECKYIAINKARKGISSGLPSHPACLHKCEVQCFIQMKRGFSALDNIGWSRARPFFLSF